MTTLFQNMNPSNILQHINERAHPLKHERDFDFNFWGSNSFKLEEQIVPQPAGHLLTLSHKVVCESHSRRHCDGMTQATGIHTIK